MDVVGNRIKTCPTNPLDKCEVENREEARVVADAAHSVTTELNGSVKLAWVHVPDDSSGTSYGAVAFMNTFGKNDPTSNQSKSGTTSTDIVPVPFTLPTSTINTVATQIASMAPKGFRRQLAYDNPTQGIQICLDSQDAQKHAIITIGGQSRTIATSATFNGGNCP
jgi:hypothetical protein